MLNFLIFLELTLNPPEGIIAGPINEENFFEWEALITLDYIHSIATTINFEIIIILGAPKVRASKGVYFQPN